MSFTTLTFALFLAAVFSVHWAVRSRVARNAVIVVASFLFYSWWDYRFAILMLSSVSVDYAVSLAMNRTRNDGKRRGLLLASIGYNLSVLCFFKYFNFFAETVQTVFAALGWEVTPFVLKVVLPVGISFYTFQSMSYTIDVYRKKLEPTRSWLDYATFVCFFPQLVAGPIERAGHLLSQFQRERVFDAELARDGCRQILWGVFKKMVLADNLARLVDLSYGTGLADASGVTLAVATLFFAFQIYFDFSAYSDIAIGTAKLFGVDLMQNFKTPYFSASIPEFWRRWHISLSTWFRDYVFVPLGGSRCGRARWARNILITFGVSGLWHGASWNFVIWGLLNGVAVLLWTLAAGGSQQVPQPWVKRFCGVLLTFGFINVTWVFFRAETLPDALMVLGRITTDVWDAAAWEAFLTKNAVPLWLLVHLVAAVGLELVQRRQPHPLVLPFARPWRWLVYTVILYDVLTVGTLNRGSFIYFQF